MNDANRTAEVMREFADQLRPCEVYMVVRYETPDGPMHVQEPVTLAPFCRICGESPDECDCTDIGGEA